MQLLMYASGAALAVAAAMYCVTALARTRLRQDPYVPSARYRYVDGMERVDPHAMNRLGQRRFGEVVRAQEACTKRERLARKVADIRDRRRTA